jgi:hypothetical protein
VSTTPLTDLLRYYWQLREPGKRGFAAHLCMAQQFSKDPVELVELFERSMEQFARYSNPTQFFHEGEISGGRTDLVDSIVAGACAPMNGPPPETISRTIDFARWVHKQGVCEVQAMHDLAFGYIDRELDCLRTKPGQPLEDGTPSKGAILLDLLLKNKVDSTPILAELKIHNDQDAFYGFIQCLCAAVHLVSEPQRERLRSVYGLTSALKDSGPYLDLYVIFFKPREKGKWPEVLGETLKLRDRLLQQPAIAKRIRRIEFLESRLRHSRLEFARMVPSKPSGE